jgi:hypothetical protein
MAGCVTTDWQEYSRSEAEMSLDLFVAAMLQAQFEESLALKERLDELTKFCA